MDIAAASDALFSTTMTGAAQYDNLSAGALGSGIDKMMARDYAAAIQEFRRTISLSPYSDNALKAIEFMANAYTSDGKAEEAKKTLRNGIRLFPTADNLHVNLGNILFSEEDYAGAIAEYAAAVKKNPTSNLNHYSLGQAYRATENYSDAEAQFKEVIRLMPNDSAGYYALGQTYRMAGRYAEAEDQLAKALSLKSDFSYVNYELGVIYAEQKELDKANQQLEMIEESAPELYTDLLAKISENTAPKMLAAYSTSINLSLPPGTLLSTVDSALATPNARKNFTIDFIFDKAMDIEVVQNITNWEISRSTSYETGGTYNWGRELPSTEISVSSMPLSVYYDRENLTAKVTFTIAQNATGDGTIDPSHLVFKFKGTDMFGNSMDSSADQYNGISVIA